MPDLHLQTNRMIRIGVLVPFTNTNLEPDMMRMCPHGASVHFTCIGGYPVNQAMMFSVMKGLLPNTVMPNFGRLFDQLKR